ncbi:MAG TPA: FAD-dependent oxidoreductase [Methylocella sp.]|nr:FAD-dependent oxidoreductase [Methylocella sp.]
MGERLIVVGNGMAAVRFVDEITKRAPGRFDLLVIGAEPRLAYNRVLLSPLLANEIGEDAIELKPRSWWTSRGITTIEGQAAAAVDRQAKTVTLNNGARFAYSKLVLSLGSEPIRLPLPGMNFFNVFTFRDLADVCAIRFFMQKGARAVVIGGGLLGIEAAHGLAKAGVEVVLVHVMDRLMERQLDHRAAGFLRAAVEARGVRVLLNANTVRVYGEGCAAGVEFADGRRIEADFIVCAAGVRPRVQLAKDAGLTAARGILVDDHMVTSDPDILAIGECAEHRGTVYGLVEPAYEQAAAAADWLSGNKTAAYRGSTLAANLKVSGVNLFSAGDFLPGPSSEVVTFEDDGEGIYKKFVIEAGRLKGAVLFGDTSDALWHLEWIRSGKDISSFRAELAFGPDFALPQAA